MKLIIEKYQDDDETVYAYIETEDVFNNNEPRRKSQNVKLRPSLLDHDCVLQSMPVGYMVFNLSKNFKRS